MNLSKFSSGRADAPIFVEWEKHWYGVPAVWADNMRQAGFEVRMAPPGGESVASERGKHDG